MNDLRFDSPEALADWLDGLHEMNADGSVLSNKWEPARVAAEAIRASLETA